MSVASRARCELIHTSDLGLAILRQPNAYRRKPLVTAARRRPGRRTNRLFWVLPAAVLLFTAEITFIVTCVYARTLVHAKTSDIPVIVASPPLPILREARLGLRVDVQPGGLRVSWTPEASLVQSASHATLRIDEALQHRDIHLDPSQMADGSILYRPSSDDVTFRLELQRPGNSSLSQTARVIGASRPQADMDPKTGPPSRKRNIAKPPMTHSWDWLENMATIKQPRVVPAPVLQRPPAIALPTVQNPGSLPFTPGSSPPPAYSPPERRSKFFTTTIKHFGSIIKDPRKRGTSEAFMPSR